MSEAAALRKQLEKELLAGLATVGKLGPMSPIVEFVPVPGKPRPAKLTFRLAKRQGHWLEYIATCPRGCKGVITVQTEMGANGRTTWPPVKGFPQLCERCEEEPVSLINRDDIWANARAEQNEQLKEQRRRMRP